MSRQALPGAERELRSRLTHLLYDQPLLRGTLGIRKITCGSPTCHCAAGQTHDTLYLTYGRGGKRHQVSIPRELESQVRQWVYNYHRVLAGFPTGGTREHRQAKAHRKSLATRHESKCGITPSIFGCAVSAPPSDLRLV